MSDRSSCTVTVRPANVKKVVRIFGEPDDCQELEDGAVELSYHSITGGGFDEEALLQKTGKFPYVHYYDGCSGSYDAGISARLRGGAYMNRQSNMDGHPVLSAVELAGQDPLEVFAQFRRDIALIERCRRQLAKKVKA
jgi:hypothetical protein